MNGKNPFNDQNKYTTLNKVSSEISDKKTFDLFSSAIEITTPQGILNNLDVYSEVNVKNAKVVGVISDSSKNYQFCKEQAKKLNVPLFRFNGKKVVKSEKKDM